MNLGCELENGNAKKWMEGNCEEAKINVENGNVDGILGLNWEWNVWIELGGMGRNWE
jgi:hypothetical protein